MVKAETGILFLSIWTTFSATNRANPEIGFMKILHTADWHLGKRLDRFDRLPEQRQVMDEICRIADAENVDVVLVAGDLYDTFNPPIEATELFYQTLKRLANGGKRPVIAIAGNHDSPDRIEAPDPLARECGIILAGFPHSEVRPFQLESGLAVIHSEPGFITLTVPGIGYPLRVLLTPYANEGRLRKDLGAESPEAQMRELLEAHWKELAYRHCNDQGVNLLVAHLLVMSQGDEVPDENTAEEKSMGPTSIVYTQNLPEGIQYAALGHIHGYCNMPGGPCPAVYPSSPLTFSFPTRGQNAAPRSKNVVIVEVMPGKPAQYRPVALTSGLPVLRRQFPNPAAAVEWLRENQECYVELSIETENYISAEDRRQIMTAHSRVVGPIPVFTNAERIGAVHGKAIDVSRTREELFQDYFLHSKGVEANAELMELFREIERKEVAK